MAIAKPGFHPVQILRPGGGPSGPQQQQRCSSWCAVFTWSSSSRRRRRNNGVRAMVVKNGDVMDGNHQLNIKGRNSRLSRFSAVRMTTQSMVRKIQGCGERGGPKAVRAQQEEQGGKEDVNVQSGQGMLSKSYRGGDGGGKNQGEGHRDGESESIHSSVYDPTALSLEGAFVEDRYQHWEKVGEGNGDGVAAVEAQEEYSKKMKLKAMMNRERRSSMEKQGVQSETTQQHFGGALTTLIFGASLLSERLNGVGIVQNLELHNKGFHPILLSSILMLITASAWPEKRERENPGLLVRVQMAGARFAYLGLAATIASEMFTGRGVLSLLDVETGVEAFSDVEAVLIFLTMLVLTGPQSREVK